MMAWAVVGLVAGLLVPALAGPAQAGWPWTTLEYPGEKAVVPQATCGFSQGAVVGVACALAT